MIPRSIDASPRIVGGSAINNSTPTTNTPATYPTFNQPVIT